NALFPSLGLSYVVVPAELVKPCARICESLGLITPILYQLALTDFLTEGHLARHLRRMRTIYLSRRNALIAAINDVASDLLTIGSTEGGMHLVAFLPDEVDDQEVVRRAAMRGIFPQALSTCYARQNSRRGLILGFGGSEEGVLTRSVSVLASLIRNHS